MRHDLKKTLVTAGAFFIFFWFGFLDNLKGPTIPFILKDLGIGYSLMGNVLGLQYGGFFLATLAAGVLIFRFGLKKVFLGLSMLLLAGIGCAAAAPGYAPLVLGFFLTGLGLGAVEVAGNSTIVLLHPERKGKLLNLLGFFHGVGSMIVPIYAGALLSAHYSWRFTFALSLAPLTLFLIYLLAVKFPEYRREAAENIFALLKSAFTAEMIWHYLAICFYVAAEIGLAAWIIEYNYKIKGQPLFYSSLSLTLYFGLITGGRLLGSFVVDRLGHLRVLLAAALGAVVCLTLGLYGPAAVAFFLPATGFCFSIIFPTLTTSFSNICQAGIEKYLGFLFTFAGIGGMIGPWLIGLCGGWLQLGTSMSLLILYALIMLGSIAVLLGKAGNDLRVSRRSGA
ncbi:fucose permease [Hydrogenispora ethanolica]|uniref:Fucose permease n=1 Tax=Hydrogenispora ethanolica TaxID=1082276 RepID=A0A4R1R9N6_HYDET|nr:MFS transporter [Hydrogenispora ethanolica]TCL62290.1 fucose permease [Hydrogenispora ethanolica]